MNRTSHNNIMFVWVAPILRRVVIDGPLVPRPLLCSPDAAKLWPVVAAFEHNVSNHFALDPLRIL